MKQSIFIVLFSFCAFTVNAQVLDKEGVNNGYEELPDPNANAVNANIKSHSQRTTLNWGSIDVRYSRSVNPNLINKQWSGTAWKGERVNAQAVLWTPLQLNNVTFDISDFRCGKSVIPSSNIKKYFVRYVMTDELNKDKKSGCSSRNKQDYDSLLVADVLDNRTVMNQVSQTRPLWMNIWVPQSAQAGTYKATLTVKAKGMKSLSLPMTLKVVNRVLPLPKDWQFHLDLWQNPYAVARFYGVELWSKEHFDLMRPIMKMLADAGESVITCSIMHWPWNAQTEDPFESMVMRQKNIDGSWNFDYTVFDKWVSFMMSLGIDKQIDCYTLVPWALKFDYYDQATNTVQYVHASPGDKAYEDYWLPFLKDFAKHLKSKGWFNRTAIAMDERPMDLMRAAFNLLMKADPDYKVAGACKYYPEVEPKMYDMSLSFYDKPLTADVMKARKAAGHYTTCYTCCVEAYPNTFTFSEPAEATLIPWNAIAGGYDGYLRWAYNSWTKAPLQDSRFRTWAAGDCYLVYPVGSSIRFERLIEGIQDVEKIRCLRKIYADRGESEKLKPLEEMIQSLTPANLKEHNASKTVNKAKKVLEEFD